MTGRFSVWSVGRDGSLVNHTSHDSGGEALLGKVWAESFHQASGQVRKVGITDNESPESGDVSERLAEEVSK